MLSKGTIEYIYRVIKSLFNRSMDWQMLKKHPIEGIKKPKVIQMEMQYYDENEAQLAIEALYKEPTMWQLFYYIYKQKHLINCQWSSSSKALKSKASKRTITMPEWFMKK